jgi:hypothetical protein
LAILIPLLGCANTQKEPREIIPKYDSDFLNCVADEMEARNYGACTERVVTDWVVMIGG